MRSRVIFVTDPICSWCWGMLPEILATRDRLAARMEFDLMMAGLQIGSKRPMATWEIHHLKKIWREVEQTTGQPFCGRLPDDDQFIYHSETPCRAVEVMRDFQDEPPWDFFYHLQSAFYRRARNLNDVGELIDIAAPFGISRDEFVDALGSRPVIAATRHAFQRANELAANALPMVLLDTGEGPRLVCGGYATASYLTGELKRRTA